MKILTLIAAFAFATPALATPCEDAATVSQVQENLLCTQFYTCSAGNIKSSKDLVNMKVITPEAKQQLSAIKGMNPTMMQFLTELDQAAADLFGASASPYSKIDTLFYPHAMDYNESIKRYECQISVAIDRATFKRLAHFDVYAQIFNSMMHNDVSNTMAMFIMEMIKANNTEKMEFMLKMNLLGVDNRIDNAIFQPILLNYAVQDTENGTLVQVESLAPAIGALLR
jgi:hypothetical protein